MTRTNRKHATEATKINTEIAILVAALATAEAGRVTADRTAMDAADAAAPDVLAHPELEDLYCATYAATYAAHNGKGHEAEIERLRAEIIRTGRRLAEAVARAAGLPLPADVVTMYDRAEAGQLTFVQRMRLIDHLSNNAGRKIV